LVRPKGVRQNSSVALNGRQGDLKGRPCSAAGREGDAGEILHPLVAGAARTE